MAVIQGRCLLWSYQRQSHGDHDHGAQARGHGGEDECPVSCGADVHRFVSSPVANSLW